MSRRPLALVAAAAVAAALSVAPARAQPAGGGVELVLVRISPATGPTVPLVYQVAVRNHGGSALRDLRVDARLGPPVQTRSELASLVAAPPTGSRPLGAWRPRLAEVPAGGSRTLEPQTVPLPADLAAQRAGAVLPLAIGLTAAGDAGPVSAQLGTFVVVVSQPVPNPLRIALLVPLHEPTHRDPRGVFADDGLARLLAPGGALGGIAAELDRPHAPAVSVVADALLAEDAAAMSGAWRLRQGAATVTVPSSDPRSAAARQFYEHLRQAAGASRDNPPAAFPYAAADLPALVRAGQDAEAAVQIQQGRRLLQAAIGTAPDQDLAWPVNGPIDAATLKTLASSGADAVVLDASLLPSLAPTTQNATVDLGGGVAPLRALVPDPAMAVALADGRAASEPAAWAQRVLAETAVAWLERPNSSERRGVLLAPPQVWRPAPAFFDALVRGLAAAPWLRLEQASRLAQEVPQGPDEDRRELAAVAPVPGLPGSYLRGVAKARARLASLRGSAGSDYRPPSGDFDRDLLLAESSDWRPAAARPRGQAFVRAVDAGIKSVYAKVKVEPTRAILTARRGTIPVTLNNTGDQRLVVVLRLSSPRVDVPPAPGEPLLLPPHRRTTQLIKVGTRTTGSFPIQVDALTLDGRETVARGNVTLVSTAFNRVALVLAGGAAGFLLLWWQRGRRRRGAPPGGGRRGGAA